MKKTLLQIARGLTTLAIVFAVAFPNTGLALMFLNVPLLGSAPAGTFKVFSGTYTGTGATSGQTITLGCEPVVTIIKANATGAEDDSYIFSPSAAISSKIIPTTAQATYGYSSSGTGFSVPGPGTADPLNSDGVAYFYASICGDSTEVFSGSYTGNATDDRSITGVGFQPDMVFIKRANTVVGVIYRSTTMSTNNAFDLGGAAGAGGNTIQDFETDGFQVGTSGAVNASGATYNYVAIKVPSGGGNCGNYTGNSTDNTDITTTAAILPEWVFIKGNAAVNPVMRGDANSGDQSSLLGNSLAVAANRIQALNADGFEVGTNGEVNTSATTYYYCALKDE